MVSKGGQEVTWVIKDVISASPHSFGRVYDDHRCQRGYRCSRAYTVAGKTGTGQQVVEETGSYGENSGFVDLSADRESFVIRPDGLCWT